MSRAKEFITEVEMSDEEGLDSLSSIKVFEWIKKKIEAKPAAQQAVLYSGLVNILGDYIVMKTPSGEIKFKGLVKEFMKSHM